jgi:uncharacterized protein
MGIHLFSTDSIAPEPFAPDAGCILSGTPEGDTRNGYESADGNKFVGEWSCSAGSWRVSYSEWEYCRILEGRVRLTADNGHVTDAGPGDNLIIEPGFAGIWENLEPVRKIYVIDLGVKDVCEPC